MDAIKLVRGLDQAGPGENGANLTALWSTLTASSDGSFHAAEESSLRWLLKSMNGTSADAETIRRFPLTWAILECVFQRIPLFSLAKSLADRKFLSILQRALRDISQNTPTNGTATRKRKRPDTSAFELETLKQADCCLETAANIFKAIKALLDRLDDPSVVLGRDKIGAEHIKSLFCNSAAESVALVSPALALCKSLLASEAFDTIGCETWPSTISAIWVLHLQDNTDPMEIVLHLFSTCATLFAEICGLSGVQKASMPAMFKSQWGTALQHFLQRNLILPAKEAFINSQSFEIISKSLDVSQSSIHYTAPALYQLVLDSPEQLQGKERRRHAVEWQKQVFRTIEENVKQRQDKNDILSVILKQAVQHSASVDVKDLRKTCHSYAFAGEATDWKVLANISECDPSIFQSTGDGSDLLDTFCQRVAATSLEDLDTWSVPLTRIVESVKKAFVLRRDVLGYLELWFTQLCKSEEKSMTSSPWRAANLRDSTSRLRLSLIETLMSPHQTVEFIGWIQKQNYSPYPQSVCIIFDAITEGLTNTTFIDAIGTTLFQIIWPHCRKADGTALKWRVIRRTLAWSSWEDKTLIWKETKDAVTKLLRKKHASSVDALEAFKYCYQAWDSMMPDHDLVAEPAALITEFSTVLSKHVTSSEALQDMEMAALTTTDLDSPFTPETSAASYVQWYLCGCSRFIHLSVAKGDDLPEPVQDLLSLPNTSGQAWNSLLENDINLNDAKASRITIDKLIGALKQSASEKSWPTLTAMACMQALSRIPSDNFNRWQREHIMEVIDKQTSKLSKPRKLSIQNWRAILSLALKVLSRSTFHKRMTFETLQAFSSALFAWSKENCEDEEQSLEIISRFSSLACAHAKQMADIDDERSSAYFNSATTFINDSNAGDIHAFDIVLHKALAVELAGSSRTDGNAAMSALLQTGRNKIEAITMHTMEQYVEDKKLLQKQDSQQQLQLFAMVDAASILGDLSESNEDKLASGRKLEKRTYDDMQQGHLKSWQIQLFLRKHMLQAIKNIRPVKFDGISKLPRRLEQTLLAEYIDTIAAPMAMGDKVRYLRDVIAEYTTGCEADGQAKAIFLLITHIIGSLNKRMRQNPQLLTFFPDMPETFEKQDGFDLSAAYSELISSIPTSSASQAVDICRSLYSLLEKRPQTISQWNVEITLSTICDLSSTTAQQESTVPYTWLCKLVEVIIKKHRLRLEGHYHLLLATIQTLLRTLIAGPSGSSSVDQASQDSKAQSFARLVTLICEPTAGAVSRSQHQGSLDSATDAAKRTAGRHMYLVLTQYVKLQLEVNVLRTVSEILEPALNAIFDITPPEGRKILNDGMDTSGRAILREMFKRYQKFGKWSGV